MSTRAKNKKQSYNGSRNKQSVNPAKNNRGHGNIVESRGTTLPPVKQSQNKKTTVQHNINTLVKPDPTDKEATRAYYEARSIAKVKGEWKDDNKKKDTVKETEESNNTQRSIFKKNKNNDNKNVNHIRKRSRTNPFKYVYLVFRTALTKQLKKEDYFRVILGIISLIIIFAMVGLPLLSSVNWSGLSNLF